MKVLVTGGEGFIGRQLCARLMQEEHYVASFDMQQNYAMNTVHLSGVGDIRHHNVLQEFFAIVKPDAVIHLAALAGVRRSLQEPHAYVETNVHGTLNVLECCRHFEVKRLLFASSSSVYGQSHAQPFVEDDLTAPPRSVYAATKHAGELLCQTYASLYGMHTACLRFFSVYGPWQRPDLAMHTFAMKMLAGKPITMFGDGSSQRDYTYIDDIVEGIILALAWTDSTAPACCIPFNVGSGHPISLHSMIALLEEALGIKAIIHRHPDQPGDVSYTCADLTRARNWLGYFPKVPLKEGMRRFTAWMRAQHA